MQNVCVCSAIEDLADGSDSFIVALTAEGKTPVQFTDYPRLGEQSNFYDEVKIWEAACATSAATSFFSPIKIRSGEGYREFLDGAFNANTPVFKLWLEAKAQFGPLPLEPRISCLVYLGTGKPQLKAFDDTVVAVGRSVIDIATETQTTAALFHEEHEDLANQARYFRFNPPDVGDVGLEEAGKRTIIEVTTEAYGNDPEVKQICGNSSRLLRMESPTAELKY